MELTNAIPAQSGIYKITNIINNKIYIGQSKNLYKRLKDYIYEASYYRDTKRIRRPIIFAIKKYGLKNFEFDVIELTIDLNEREKYWISYYNATDRTKGYNIEKGGSGTSHNKTLSEKSRYNMGSRQRGKKVSKKTRKKRKATRERLGQNFKVKCVEDGKIFSSLKELKEYYSKVFNVSPTSIHASEVINGKRKKDHGLTFIKC